MAERTHFWSIVANFSSVKTEADKAAKALNRLDRARTSYADNAKSNPIPKDHLPEITQTHVDRTDALAKSLQDLAKARQADAAAAAEHRTKAAGLQDVAKQNASAQDKLNHIVREGTEERRKATREHLQALNAASKATDGIEANSQATDTNTSRTRTNTGATRDNTTTTRANTNATNDAAGASRDAAAAQRAHTTALNDHSSATSRASSATRSRSREVTSFTGNMRTFNRIIAESTYNNRAWALVMKMIPLTAVTSALNSLTPAIGALGAGFIGLAGTITPVVRLLGALPTMATAAVGGIMGAVAGLGGIFSTMGAYLNMNKAISNAAQRTAATSARTESSRARNIADTTRSITRARRDQVRAAENIADAERNIADVARNNARTISDAEESIADAQKDARRAQQNITDARKQAAQQLSDYRLQLRGAALDEESATLSLQEARIRLRQVLDDPGTTSLERKQADLAAREAELRLDEVRDSNKKLQQEADEAAAKGVENSDLVVSAKEAEVAANERLADAQVQLQDAYRDAAQNSRDAQRQLKDAQRSYEDTGERISDLTYELGNLNKGLQANGEAADPAATQIAAYNAALAALGPNARAAVTELIALHGAWQDITYASQEAMGPGLVDFFQALRVLLPDLSTFIVNMADGFGDFLSRIGYWLTLDGTMSTMNTIFRDAEDLMFKLGAATENTLKWLGGLGQAAADSGLTQWIGDTLVRWTDGWAQATTTPEGLKETTQKMEEAMTYAEKWGRVLSNTWGALGGMMVGLRPLGDFLLDGLVQVTDQWEKWTKSDEGMDRMATWSEIAIHNFQGLGKVVGALWENMSQLMGGDAEYGTDEYTKNVEDNLAKIDVFWEKLAEFILTIGDLMAIVGPTMIDSLLEIGTSIAEVLKAFGTHGGMDAVVGMTTAFSEFANGIEWLLKTVPILAPLIVALMAAFSVKKGFEVVGSLTGITGTMKTLDRTRQKGYRTFNPLKMGTGTKRAFALDALGFDFLAPDLTREDGPKAQKRKDRQGTLDELFEAKQAEEIHSKRGRTIKRAQQRRGEVAGPFNFVDDLLGLAFPTEDPRKLSTRADRKKPSQVRAEKEEALLTKERLKRERKEQRKGSGTRFLDILTSGRPQTTFKGERTLFNAGQWGPTVHPQKFPSRPSGDSLTPYPRVGSNEINNMKRALAKQSDQWILQSFGPDALNKHYRKLFDDGQTMADIARGRDTTVDAVRNRLRRQNVKETGNYTVGTGLLTTVKDPYAGMTYKQATTRQNQYLRSSEAQELKKLGFTAEEIAQDIGVSVSTIRKDLKRVVPEGWDRTIKQAENSTEKLGNQIEDTAKDADKLSDKVEDAGDDVDDLGDKAKRSARKLDDFADESDDVEDSAKDAAKSVDRLGDEIDDAGDQAKKSKGFLGGLFDRLRNGVGDERGMIDPNAMLGGFGKIGGLVGKAAGPIGFALSGITSMVGNFLRSFGQIAGVAGTTLAIVGSGFVRAALDGKQAAKSVTRVFEDSASTVNEAAEEVANQFGLSETAYKQYASALGTSMKDRGIKDFTQHSTDLISLGADIAEEYGISVPDAIEALSSAVAGDGDAVREFGIDLSESAIQAELARMGAEGLTDAALEQAEAQAILNLIHKDTIDIQGQASDSTYTFEQRVANLRAKWSDFSQDIGESLLPALESLFGWVDSKSPQIEAALGRIADNFSAFTAGLTNSDGDRAGYTAQMETWADRGEVAARMLGNIADNGQAFFDGLTGSAASRSDYTDQMDAWAGRGERVATALEGVGVFLSELGSSKRDREDFSEDMEAWASAADGVSGFVGGLIKAFRLIDLIADASFRLTRGDNMADQAGIRSWSELREDYRDIVDSPEEKKAREEEADLISRQASRVDAQRAFADKVNAANGGRSATYNTFKTMGNDIPDGLADGLDEGMNRRKGDIDKSYGLLPTWAREKYEINSPSRVFFGIGGHVADGFVNGMTAGLDRLFGNLSTFFEDMKTKVGEQGPQLLTTFMTAVFGPIGGAFASWLLGLRTSNSTTQAGIESDSKSWGDRLSAGIRGTFDNLWKSLTGSQNSFGTDFANGWARIASKTDSAVRAIVNWVNENLIGGPSGKKGINPIAAAFGIKGEDGTGWIKPIQMPSKMQALATGGKVRGFAPNPKADNVLIRATPGEYMLSNAATSYYGYDVAEAINRRMIPKESFQGLANGGQVAPVPGRANVHPHPYYSSSYAADYPNPAGTPVGSWKDGVVSLVKYLTTSYGYHVRVNHDDGSSSLYAHLSKILVGVGQRLNAGQTLGLVGNTGNSFGNHLHFETYRGIFNAIGSALSGVEGLGDMFMDKLGDMINGPKEAMKDFGPFGEMLANIPGKLADHGKEALRKKITEMGHGLLGNIGGGAEQWRGVVLEALARLGMSSSYADATLRQIQEESGGNPRAINLTDINARNGIPSVGLLQVIPSTFAAYRDPSLPNDRTNPLANVVAALRYVTSRYGSPAAWDRLKGYSEGGWTGPGGRLEPKGVVHGDEYVIKKSSRRRIERQVPGMLDYMNENGNIPGYANGGLVTTDPSRYSLPSHLRGYTVFLSYLNAAQEWDLSNPVSQRRWETRKHAEIIERLLSNEGFLEDRRIDGHLGEAEKAGWKRWQARIGQAQTGMIDWASYTKLLQKYRIPYNSLTAFAPNFDQPSWSDVLTSKMLTSNKQMTEFVGYLNTLRAWGMSYAYKELKQLGPNGLPDGYEQNEHFTVNGMVLAKEYASNMDRARKYEESLREQARLEQEDARLGKVGEMVSLLGWGTNTNYSLATIAKELSVSLDTAAMLFKQANESGWLKDVSASRTTRLRGDVADLDNLFKFSKGGIVPGVGDKDTVLALLTPGELVVPKDIVGQMMSPVSPATPYLNLNNRIGKMSDTRESSGQTVYQFNTNVYNPVAEESSMSVQKRVKNVATLGMLGGKR